LPVRVRRGDIVLDRQECLSYHSRKELNAIMKRTLILILAAAACAFAQDAGKTVTIQGGGPAGAVAFGAFERSNGAPVVGAPYSATITNESIQTLSDGNRIVQSSTGTTVRDSQGRTRQDAPLPAIGNLSAANPPHIVFLQDPVAQTSYTLNLTDKTAMKVPALPGPPPGGPGMPGPNAVYISTIGGASVSGTLPPPPPGSAGQKVLIMNDQGPATTEDLGSQTMEGVFVTGTRTMRTIPAGQIGNDNPIRIVTEVWTSPDLKTVVYSKRSDPRVGEQTFRLTNIMRTEPDASLFAVPPDFKVMDGPQPILYRTNQ
jgi:hypothetical protein